MMKSKSIFLIIISWCLILAGQAAGSEFSICTDAASQSLPSISGYIVVWDDCRNGNDDIYGYDLSTTCVSPPQTDTNNDCKIDMSDFVNMAAEWLTCGRLDPYTCWE